MWGLFLPAKHMWEKTNPLCYRILMIQVWSRSVMPAETCGHCLPSDCWTAQAIDSVNMNKMWATLDALTALLNNRGLLRHQRLLPMSTLFSKQPANCQSSMGLKRQDGVVVSISTLAVLLLELFFWSFMCRRSGQLRSSKNVLRGWWLFKPSRLQTWQALRWDL